MKAHFQKSLLVIAILAAIGCAAQQVSETSEPVIKRWTEVKDGKTIRYMTIDGVMIHDWSLPRPKVVIPGCDHPGGIPSDAIVLFDGTRETMEKEWTNSKWSYVDGVMESMKKAGYNVTRRKFGSCQLHIEWASPSEVKGSDQTRGNSGVFLMDYEVQILDSFDNRTYPPELRTGGIIYNETYRDGQAGALYGRNAPLVNACRGPGQWQTYDIIFHRPIFNEDGTVLRKATFTVLHNGVLIQDHVVLSGGTGWEGPYSISEYKKHDDTMPIRLQDHGNPVRFRNIWIRPLEDKPIGEN